MYKGFALLLNLILISIFTSAWASSNTVTILGLSIDPATSVQAGSPVSVTANVSETDGKDIYYKFYYSANYGLPEYETTPWTMVQDYSLSNSAQISFPSNGDYIIVVRAVTDPLNEPVALPIIGQVLTVGSSTSVNIAGMSASVISNTNKTVNFSLNATSEIKQDIYYKFYYSANYGLPEYDTTPWTLVQGYSTKSSAQISFPSAGDYIVVVRAVTDPNNEPDARPIIGGVVSIQDSDSSFTAGDTAIPTDETQKLQAYNLLCWEYTHTLQKMLKANYELVEMASNGFTETIDDYEMTSAQMDQFNAKMDSMLPDMAKSLLYGYDISNFEESISAASVVSSPQSSPQLGAPRFLVSGALAIAGAAITIKGLYDYGFKSYKSQFKIAEDVITNTVPGSKEHKLINSQLGLDEDTSPSEILRNFKQESFFSKNRLSKAIIQANSIEGDDTANDKRRVEIKNTANEGGTVAVKTTVGLATTATGGQLVDKVAKAAGFSEPVAGLIDLYVTHKGAQPLDKFANSVTITVQSEKTKNVSVPKPDMPSSTAKEVLKEIASGKDTQDFDPESWISALNTILNEIAKKLPNSTINSDGSVNIDVPESIHMENHDTMENEEWVSVPEMGEANITVTAEGKKPELIESMDLSIIAEIVLEAAEIPDQNTDSNLSLSSEKSGEDGTSVNYAVTASVKGITAPTSITLSVENAATSNATQILSSDGSLTWTVTVLDKDATATVRRNDTQESASVVLKAKAQEYDGTYTGSFTTTFEAEDTFCWSYGDLGVVISGTAMSGDATGTLSGNTVSGTGEYGMVFSGSIANNVLSGSWHDPEGGCAGTFRLTRQ